MEQIEPKDEKGGEDRYGARPRYNTAPYEEQVQIGKDYAYGETLIEVMKGLESDQICEGLWLGTMGDAAYVPFREYAKITHVVNVAAEA